MKVISFNCNPCKILTKQNCNLWTRLQPHSQRKKVEKQIILTKEKFPYIRYNRTFSKTVVSPIVNTHVLIFHNDYINDYVKENVINFETIILFWK